MRLPGAGRRACEAMLTVVDSQDRRSRILLAAAALFLEKGYAGVSMEDVLSEVGGSKSTLYRYFTDKTALFRAAVEMLIDERSRPLRTFQPGDSDAAETLREYGRHFADIVLAPGAIALHRLVTAEAERVPGLGQTFYEHGPAFGNALMGDYLRGLCEAGVIEVPDPMLASAQLYQAMLGALQMRLLINAPAPSPAETELSIANAVETFLNGALPRASAARGRGRPSVAKAR